LVRVQVVSRFPSPVTFLSQALNQEIGIVSGTQSTGVVRPFSAMETTARLIDITELPVDAIVNAANETLAPGGGVCGAIHRVAGPRLAAACARVAPCPTGEARITPGFGLSARFVIHAVGPVWTGGDANEPELLASAYRWSLSIAHEKGLASVAFPAISTGIYGYPLADATRIAVAAVSSASEDCPRVKRVVFACFSEDALDAYLREGVREDQDLLETFDPSGRRAHGSPLGLRLTVRAAGASDADAIGRISADREGRDRHKVISAVRRSLEDKSMGEGSLILVAEVDGRVVGFGKARYLSSSSSSGADALPGGWYLTGLVVDPRFRRRGIGTRLTSERLRWIAERSRRVYYFANARNRVSMALHDAHGFVEIARAPQFGEVTFVGGEGVLFAADLEGTGPKDS